MKGKREGSFPVTWVTDYSDFGKMKMIGEQTDASGT
jgi:hypothetical protein